MEIIPMFTSHHDDLYGCFQKWSYLKKDGENNRKPYEQMDDLGGFSPLFSECHPYTTSPS